LKYRLFFYGDYALIEQAKYLAPKSEIETKFYRLCSDAMTKLDLSIYDLQYSDSEQTLRLFIENPANKTATLAECSSVDRSLTDLIEESDFIPEGFVLEVSSPGVFRHLSSVEHFKSIVDQRISVLLKKKIDVENIVGVKRVIGKLVSVTDSDLSVEAEEHDRILSLPLEMIKKANVEPHWDDIKETTNK
jgi:ribosome maturation factor RimP